MLISYGPLWKTMEDKGVTTYMLIEKYNINPRTISHLKHDRSVTAYTLEKLCRILDCPIEAVIKILPEEEDMH